jgi:sortase (surface protein transpeptidase)
VARPVRIAIPAIGVSAPVIPLGLNRDGTLEVPKRWDDAGWWTGGPEPGERGPAVIAGHVDSRTGPAVFFRLRELGRGDRIVVRRRDGSSVAFVVGRIAQYSKDHFPTARVYGRTAQPALRLITCSGEFDETSGHYLDNTVVFASWHRWRASSSAFSSPAGVIGSEVRARAQ